MQLEETTVSDTTLSLLILGFCAGLFGFPMVILLLEKIFRKQK